MRIEIEIVMRLVWVVVVGGGVGVDVVVLC